MPLVVVEGLDYCGKSTQVKLLHDSIKDSGREDVLILREPGGTPIGENIRQHLLDTHLYISDLTELFLFCASRAQLVEEVIRPFLQNDGLIIMDRFFEATLAYQGHGRGISLKLLKEIHDEILAKGGTYPDVTFFIDLPPSECFKRANGDMLDRIESQSTNSRFYEKVYKGYQQITNKWNHVISVDGIRSEEAIHKDIVQKLISLKII